MQRSIAVFVLTTSLLSLGATASLPAQAQTNISSDLSTISLMPVASVVGTASAVAGAVVAVPVAFSTAGALLVVKSIEMSAKGTVYVLERVSDGARVSVEVSGKVAKGASIAVGTTVAVSAITAGTVLSVAGEVIAFIPNEMGRALMHSERVSK